MKWTNSYRSFGLKTKRSTGLKTIEHKQMVSWAEPGSRFTRDFESECAWPVSVANQKTVGGFPHIVWRTAGDIARRVAERLGTAMPSPFDGLAAIGVATMC